MIDGLSIAPGDAAGPAALLERQRAAFLREGPPDAARRRQALARLGGAVRAERDAIVAAIAEDFGHRSRHETLLAEVMGSLEAIGHAERRVARWMRPRRRPLDRTKFGFATARVMYQPKGVVGIISPWNYPLLLALSPLAGALAAGNRAMLKPSEVTPRTAALLQRLIAGLFPEEEVAVVTGDAALGAAFSRLPFDHLMFTGSTAVGREVMKAAAENLVPVTLELGGKSPAIVAPGYPLDRAAESIMTGKLFNAGQTCIAPDYALVPAAAIGGFVEACRAATARLYPSPGANPDYSAIVSDRHAARLRGLLDDAREKGASVVELAPAGEVPPNQRKLMPALVLDATEDMRLLQEEIFGPILPVLPYGEEREAIDRVNRQPRPLALYYFGQDGAARDRVLARTTSGGVTVNDTLFHVAAETLPFGGIGPSGMGAYHGFDGFVTFSHAKSVFHQARWNLAGLTRPPYGARLDRLLRLFIRD